MLQRLVETYGWITILHKYLDSYLKTTTQPPSCKSLKRTKIWLKRGKYCAADIESLVVSIFAGRGREEFTPCLENSTKTSFSSPTPTPGPAQIQQIQQKPASQVPHQYSLRSRPSTNTNTQVQKKTPTQTCKLNKVWSCTKYELRGKNYFKGTNGKFLQDLCDKTLNFE